MRFKPVPDPPAELEAVGPILAAVPDRADAVDDCCAQLVAETHLETRSEAETWLVFLRALKLAVRTDGSYRRTAETPTASHGLDRGRLRGAFRERVDGAEAVLETLAAAEDSQTVDAVAETVRTERPSFDRVDREPRERVRRLLEWGRLLEFVERTGDGRYRLVVPHEEP